MTDLTADLLARVARIAPLVREHAGASDEHRRVSDAVYDAMLDQGLFSLFVPRARGGLEVHPVTACKVWEAVAKLDSAASWNLSQANGGLGMVPYLPDAGVEQIFAVGPQPIFAGVGFPPAQAVRADGGYRLTGRVAYGSGCLRADWIFLFFLNLTGGAPEMNPATGMPVVRVGFFPRSAVQLHDTWHTMGMRGTGSNDISVEGVFVPDDLTAIPNPKAAMASGFAGPLYRLGPWPVIHGEATSSLGIAGAMIELLMDLAAGKTPAGTKTVLRDREMVQSNLGRARAAVDSARAYLHHSATEAFAQVSDGSILTRPSKMALQLAACNASEASAKAVDLMWESAGGTAIWLDQGFERHFRDVHVTTQHAQKSPARYISVGRMMLGLEPDAPILA